MEAHRTSPWTWRTAVLAAVAWALAVTITVSALGFVLGVFLSVWGVSLVAMAVLFRLDGGSSQRSAPDVSLVPELEDVAVPRQPQPQLAATA